MGKDYSRRRGKAAQLPAFVPNTVPWLAAVVFFFAVCLCSGTTVKGTVLVLLVAALVVGCTRGKTLWQRIGWPMVALSGVVAMDFVSTLYAASGKFALSEFLKVAAAFSVALLLLALTPKREENPGRCVAALLARAAALMGLVSIDLLSTRWLSGRAIPSCS